MKYKSVDTTEKRNFAQPELFDFYTDEELEIETYEPGEPDPKYLVTDDSTD